MNRKEFVAAERRGGRHPRLLAADRGRQRLGVRRRILGDNDSKLLTTKDELDNVNLIFGLAELLPAGPVSFDGGNILLGGAGNDIIIGGGGNDIIDGDACLHVGLTSYTAGGEIIRQINYDPNGNTYDPSTGAGQLQSSQCRYGGL